MSDISTTEHDLGNMLLIAGAILAVPIAIMTVKVIRAGIRNRVHYFETFQELNA